MRSIFAWSSLAVGLLCLVGTLQAQVGGGLSLSGSEAGVKASSAATPAKPPAVKTAPVTPAAPVAPAAPATPAAPAATGETKAADVAAPAASTSALPAQVDPASSEMETGTYAVRLRDIEHGVNDLKEQIFRSKARLSLLAETVLQGVVAGAQAKIVHESKMGNSYKLVKILYALDGAPLINKSDDAGALGDRNVFDVYNGSIVPGEHTLTVQLEYRGHGYGIFSYLKGYRFKVSSSHTFTAGEGKVTTLRVVGYEKGGPTAPLEERPAVRYMERVDTPQASTEAVQGGE